MTRWFPQLPYHDSITLCCVIANLAGERSWMMQWLRDVDTHMGVQVLLLS
jgi:hypothetical protein